MKKVVLLLAIASICGACHKMTFKPAETVASQKLDGPEVVDGPQPPPPPPEPPPVVVDPPPPVVVDPPPPPVVVDPPPVVVDPPTPPAPVVSSGACADQEGLLSCLKCEAPVVPPPPPPGPVMSTKAQKLAKIMSLSCQIYNKSYPKDYVAPTAQQIETQLKACSPALYPETPMSTQQVSTVARLMDETDASLRLKMFKGLWYQPPYTEYFETYFGLDGAEAAYAFCMNKPNLTPILYTSEYAAAVSSMGGYERWRMDAKAQARWKAAQKIRQQFLSCFNKPAPAVAAPETQPPAAPAAPATCEYRKFDGLFELGGREHISQALAEGFKVAIETNMACVSVTEVPAVGAFQGSLKIAAYRCQ